MPFIIPLLSGAAVAMSVALSYETGKHAKRKYENKHARCAKRISSRHEKGNS